MEKRSIVIVGGGIAGLSLAKFLAEYGIDFVLLEEHHEFFKKACGEGIITKLAGYDFFDLYESKRGIEKEIDEVCLYTKYGMLKIKMPIVTINKKIVEEEMAKQAMKGGEIMMGKRVEKIEDSMVKPQSIKAKIIVGADGVFSIVRKAIGIKKPCLGIAAQGIIKNLDMENDKLHVLIRNDIVKYGYAWFFPKKKEWNIGIGSYKMEFFKGAFKKFKEKYTTKWRAAFIPISKPLKSYGKNMLLIGDSASHVIASVGAGIMPSMIVAKISADFIHKISKKDFKNKLKEYENEWRKAIGKQLNNAYYFSNLFWKIIKSEKVRYYILKKVCMITTKFYEKLET